jgi:TRAP-type uncharacterized transport system fused permease subunit
VVRARRRVAPWIEEDHVQLVVVAFRRLRTEAAEAGMSTAEYAVGTFAAVAFAGILLKVVTSTGVQTALTALITKALK